MTFNLKVDTYVQPKETEVLAVNKTVIDTANSTEITNISTIHEFELKDIAPHLWWVLNTIDQYNGVYPLLNCYIYSPD